MILFDGKQYPAEAQSDLLARLEGRINRTLALRTLDREAVVRALDALSSRIASGEFDARIEAMAAGDAARYKKMAVAAMRRDALRFRLALELGEDTPAQIAPPYGLPRVRVESRPLGTLFHIAAGNVDGLPALSVVEGLLTGNVNILKLPSADDGLTVEMLSLLIEAEPSIAEYVYVFDTPSSDVAAMQKMAALADGIVLWGGEEATRAVRALAPPGARLIEWGHRLGFAYISGCADKEAELAALAAHIAETRQLLCSSCQTIYLNTDDEAAARAFCREFLPFLDAALAASETPDPGIAAQAALRAYCRRLEEAAGQTEERREVFRGTRGSLTLCADRKLELSDMYGNVLVKRLPAPYLLPILRRAKGTLQSAALICAPGERAALTETLLRAGVVRVMTAGNASVSFGGEAHDGLYPLRQYRRIVNVEL